MVKPLTSNHPSKSIHLQSLMHTRQNESTQPIKAQKGPFHDVQITARDSRKRSGNAYKTRSVPQELAGIYDGAISENTNQLTWVFFFQAALVIYALMAKGSQSNTPMASFQPINFTVEISPSHRQIKTSSRSLNASSIYSSSQWVWSKKEGQKGKNGCIPPKKSKENLETRSKQSIQRMDQPAH